MLPVSVTCTMNDALANNTFEIGHLVDRFVPAGSSRDATNLKNMLLLIQLRWIAVIGQIGTIAIVDYGLHIDLPLGPMFLLLAGLVVLNIGSHVWLRHAQTVSGRALLAALMLDVLALTVQLYLSGGVSNPFTGLYLLQITLSAVLLGVRAAWSIVALACACLLILAKFNLPLALNGHGAEEIFSLQITGMLVSYGLVATLLVMFITRINRNLRERDDHLAELKQRAAEEDQIVRMGLLASGAAHELGTPLASLAVILGDWQHVPALNANPEWTADIAEMQAAVQRCKSIVTGILLSSGEARGEAPVTTTVNSFLSETVNEWHAARPAAKLAYHYGFGPDLAIVSDSTIKQVIVNLLDNAFEASPNWIELWVRRDANLLVLQVVDAGPGFAPEMLAHFGKPYRSSKGRLGGGLGLFLVVNVIRKLGGSVDALNRSAGGAIVTMKLPLDTLEIGVGQRD